VHLGCFDDAVGSEIAPHREIHDMAPRRVGAGDPTGSVDDARIDEVGNARWPIAAERVRPDVALDQRRVLREVVGLECHNLGGTHLGFETLDVDFSVARQADRKRRECAVRMLEFHDDVLQGVGSDPVAVGPA